MKNDLILQVNVPLCVRRCAHCSQVNCKYDPKLAAAYAEALLDQIMNQGAEVDLAEVTRVEDHGDWKRVFTDDGQARDAKAVIIAAGVRHRMLGLPGENELVGEGISFCAVCDGDFYTGETVCVAGGGNSALQEAILLSGKCERVIMLQDLPDFTGEKKLQDILFSRPNVEKKTGVRITALNTENGSLRSVSVTPREGGAAQEIPARQDRRLSVHHDDLR